MIVIPEILNDLYEEISEERLKKAREYVSENRVAIRKVTYENPRNFSINSKVHGNIGSYDVYISAVNGELNDLNCTCEDYHMHFASCKHIAATMMEFSENSEYVKIFAGENKNVATDIELYKKFDKSEEKYKLFKKLINNFYNYNNEDEVKHYKDVKENSIKIIPKLIFNSYNKSMKLEIKIGDKQFYKIKSFPEFYDRMLNKEFYKYGAKLEFIHRKEAFEESSKLLLDFILKYSEIIKYSNESSNNYAYYRTTMDEGYITISNTGIDELFEVLKGQEVIFAKENQEFKVLFLDQMPDIKFSIEKQKNNEYLLLPNIDIYTYEIIKGREYSYFLMNKILYKCNSDFEQTTLKLLQTYRNNFSTEIVFREKELSQLFSIVYPKVKNNIKINNFNEEELKKYIPKELSTKVYLDYDEKNYITADIRFVYEDNEFNPIENQDINFPRDLGKEDEVLEMFRKSGFMLDIKNTRLILVNEDAIYNFLFYQIEEYMKKYEVLATENFKQKEIRQPKISNLGVKIENNLLKIDFSQIDFDPKELKNVIEKYKLKKKYHRLKDGSFINIEGSKTVEFLDNITSGMDVDYKQIEEGELKLPIYRSLYLDRLLENAKFINITKNEEYKNLIDKTKEKNIVGEIKLPKNLSADLRNYQKVGYEWLEVLDSYKFGGILADDMGLGKTLQVLAIIEKYIEDEKECKPSIVVCPSSLTLNWQNEAKKFTPNIKTLVIHENAKERKEQIQSILNYNLVITSYDLLKRDIEIYKQKKYNFKYIVADEAQYIKNNNTQNAKVIKQIEAEAKFALTGTPIENSLSELWSIFDFIMPGYLFNYKKFKDLYEIPIVKDEDEIAMKKLKMLIEPFILRRIKKEVLTELPDKTITVLNNEMQDEQLKIYLSYMQDAKQEAMTEISSNGFEKSQIKILALLMRLRQICCYPGLFIQNYKGESSKLTQCLEIIKDAMHAGHKILLFSSYTGMFEIIEKELKKENIKYFKLTGQTKVGERIKLVDEFNENEDIKLFLISLKAGGTGLNLIGADMVIHYDPWWNLSAENQATDRTYRIGQKRNVQVYKLITKNSIEEKIYELQEKKAKLINNMLSTNETFINKLSKEDIMELFE